MDDAVMRVLLLQLNQSQLQYLSDCSFQYYFYIPILASLTLNSLFFVITVFRLNKHRRETAVARNRRTYFSAEEVS
jgi:hypothetical protein